MSATRDDIKTWFDRGTAGNHTHMIIVCDTFDYEDYPKYMNADSEGVRREVNVIDGKSMQKVMEVYDLKKGMADQLDAHRTFNY
jgi:hypothetical protein